MESPNQLALIRQIGDLLARVTSMNAPGFVEARDAAALDASTRQLETRYAAYVDDLMERRLRQRLFGARAA